MPLRPLAHLFFEWPYQGKLEAARRKTRSSDLANPSSWTSSSVFIRRLPSCSLKQRREKEVINEAISSRRTGLVKWIKGPSAEFSFSLSRDTYEPPPPPRWLIIASSSSRKIVDGAWNRANSNRTRTSFSESPRHLLTMVDAEILKNVVLHSVATALARSVLPVPGGPYKSNAFHGDRIPVNSCGY